MWIKAGFQTLMNDEQGCGERLKYFAIVFATPELGDMPAYCSDAFAYNCNGFVTY